MIARPLLLRASRSAWLAERFRRHAFARRAVRRFVPGEDADDAVRAAAALAGEGIGTVLACLGEGIASLDEARAVADHYLALFDVVHARGLPAQVSVKLTHLGLDVDADACAELVLSLARHAAATDGFLWIDMEESHYVDRTLAIYRRAREAHAPVGVCLQAYLKRTPDDVDALLPLDPAIRLVKGAYREPPEVAHTRRRDIDAAFERIANRLMERAGPGRVLPVFGTHDMALVGRLRAMAEVVIRTPESYEVHMLYGIRETDQRALAAAGVRVRVLISYGSHWFPWYMRRLAERPANLWFVLKTLVG